MLLNELHGHEVVGEVVEIGPDVTKVSVGHRVAVNPQRSCLRCVYFHLPMQSARLNWRQIGVRQ